MRKTSKEVRTNADAFSFMSALLKQKANSPDVNGYVPHSKQLKFHKSQASQRLYIGGNRGGKTVGGAVESVYYLKGTHPYKKLPEGICNGRIVASDFKQGIDKIVLPMIQRWIPSSLLINGSWEDSYDKEHKTLTCSNNNTVEFMSYEQELVKFAGTSRHYVWFDEEPPQDIYQECVMRTLDVMGDMWFTLTPVDGMTWIYKDLYLPGIDSSNTLIDAITVRTDDNPHITLEAINRIKSSFTEDELKTRLEGSFIQRTGLIYKEFSIENNVISLADFTPNPANKLIASLDHGLNNATAWLWGEEDAEGNVTIYEEYYQREEIVSTHATNVHTINFTHGKLPDYYVGDPSIRNREPLQGSSVLQEYAANGIYLALGNNDLKAGYSRVRAYIAGVNNRKLRITNNCVNLISELSELHWASYASKRNLKFYNAKEEQHKKNDHACDSLRYLIMSLDSVITYEQPTIKETFKPDVAYYEYKDRVATVPKNINNSYDNEFAGDI
jgi:phage terminase large subunit-like protein